MRWSTFVWMLGLGVSAACGDDGGQRAGVSTGLPVDQKLSTLDDSGARTACRSLFDAMASAVPMSEMRRAQCEGHGIETNATKDGGRVQVDVAACRSFSDACVQDPGVYGVKVEVSLGDPSACDSITAESTLKGCEASVGEYEACLTQLVQVLRQQVEQITCERGAELMMSDAEEEADFDLDNIPECQTFTAKCPDVQLVPF